MAAAMLSLAAGLLLAFAVARVHAPDVIFPKYLEAAAAPAGERAERILDYSPLYLGLVRAVEATAPSGDFRATLVVQGALHGITAAAVALAVSLLAGAGWGLAAGLGAAAYRPLLVYAGVHEPETVIAAGLALAILGGLIARRLAGERAASVHLDGPVAHAGDSLELADRPQEASAPPGGRGVRGADGWMWLALALAFAPLALAGLARPQHLVLLPVWAVWISSAAPADGRRRFRRAAWMAAGISAAVLVGPVVVARSIAAGAPALMNPGPVFYEGNAPGAVGLVRFAPAAVLELERARVEAFDYGHVAYRRIASAAAGRTLSGGDSNRWWAGLAGEGLAAWPGIAVRRFARKAILALAPYEAHDLAVAEGLDRRLRPLLPWGFALLLIAVPWVFFARRERLASLAGPLSVAALALLLQIAVYASARQRLPMAVGLWVAAPVLAADLARGRLRLLRPAIALPLGLAFALAAGSLGGRIAVLDHLGWDRQIGPAAPSAGEVLLAFQEGRAQRPALRVEALRFAAGVDLARKGHPGESLRALAPLLGTGADFTVDDKTVGVPELWAARDLAALGQTDRARQMARAARAVRPQDPEVLALALALGADSGVPLSLPPLAEAFRPAGSDPVSARLVLARAALAVGDRPGALEILKPLARGFPELLPGRR